ncbi:MAG: hypothetical protein EHM44_10180 [Ignavibacteriales bacterium]|nr:hypothetical protein [Ignavibacteriales bacterium]MBP9119924.1 hypothetical protein [Ignavibacterium sp.]RPI60559.1 MAG: hypothetical protein EHM44_10180 [Ignavibacteriales bacterium]
MNTDRRRDVDLLIEEFWKKGYLTLYRKFGTYLPEPSNIGEFEVDVIAKLKDNFAIGITLSDQDFKDSSFIKNKLSYLAQRQTRGSNKKVQLFVGVSLLNLKYAKTLLDELDPETKKNIKLFPITDKPDLLIRKENRAEKILFS